MAEGEFPKTDGAILFASEANRFASAGKFFVAGSIINLISGTALQTAGSVLISAGSLGNPCILNVDFRNERPITSQTQIQISGASTNFSFDIGSGPAGTVRHTRASLFLGSPFIGMSQVVSYRAGIDNDTDASNTILFSTPSFSNLDPTAQVVIFFKLKTDGTGGIGSSSFNPYCIYASTMGI